jgi:hypothetical protein
VQDLDQRARHRVADAHDAQQWGAPRRGHHLEPRPRPVERGVTAETGCRLAGNESGLLVGKQSRFVCPSEETLA